MTERINKPFLSDELADKPVHLKSANDDNECTVVKNGDQSNEQKSCRKVLDESSTKNAAHTDSKIDSDSVTVQEDVERTFRQVNPSLNTGSMYTPNQGLKRHRLIVGFCLFISALLLVASSLDLTSAIERNGVLDSHGKLNFEKQVAELPPSLVYTRDLPSSARNSFEPEPSTKYILTSVAEPSWDRLRFGFVDKVGNVKIKPRFSDVGNFYDGITNARDFAGNDNVKGRWGFINTKGKWVVKPTFKDAGELRDGVAPVVTYDGFGGLVNAKGEWIFKTKLQTIERVGPFFTWADKNGTCHSMDKTGKEITEILKNGAISKNPKDPKYLIFRNQVSNCGVIDRNGNIVLQPIYNAVVSVNEGIATVKQADKYGLINVANGTPLFKFDWTEATEYDDIIALKLDDRTPYNFFDKHGRKLPITAPVIVTNGNKWCNDGLAPIVQNNRVSYINSKGENAFNKDFYFGEPFSNGFAQVFDGNLWYYINTKGEQVGNFRFSQTSAFNPDGTSSVKVPGFFYNLGHVSYGENTKDRLDARKRGEQGWYY